MVEAVKGLDRLVRVNETAIDATSAALVVAAPLRSSARKELPAMSRPVASVRDVERSIERMRTDKDKAEERARDAIQLAKRIPHVPLDELRRRGEQRAQAMREPASSPQRDDHSEAHRRVAEDDQQVALPPDGAPVIFVEQQVRAGVEPRHSGPDDGPRRCRAGQRSEDPLGERSRSEGRHSLA